jgi:hypothetical protein
VFFVVLSFIRVIRAFGEAKPVPKKQQATEMLEVRGNKGEYWNFEI